MVQWLRLHCRTPVFLPGKSHGWRSLVGYKSKGWQRVGHDFTFTFFSQEFLNKQNYSGKKKISDCTLDWAMTVMKHAVSVTQSVCICQNFVKRHLRFVHLCLCFVSTGKKSYEENIEFWLYMHIKASEVSEMYWYLKFTLNYIRN